MSMAPEEWLDRNNEYLGAALALLRQRLTDLVPPPEAKAAKTSGYGEWPARAFFRGRALKARAIPLLAPPERREAATNEERLARAAEGEPPPALLILERQLGLSGFEREILLMCVAAELDTGIGAAFAAAQGNSQRTYPTFALAMALFDDAVWEALSPERPLRRYGLIEISQPGATPFTVSALRADERIVNFVKGLNYLDERIASLVAPVATLDPDDLPESHRQALAGLAAQVGADGEARLLLRGADGDGKRQIASALAGMLGLRLVVLPAESIPSAGELGTIARLWSRERRLLPLALLIDAHDLDGPLPPDHPAQRLGLFARECNGLIMVSARDEVAGLEPDAARDVAKPTAREQRTAWTAALGDARVDPGLAARLASQFDLSQSDIAAVSREALAADDEAPLDARLWRGCLTRARPPLARLAERIDAKAVWDDLVLPPTEKALLHQIADQIGARATVYDDWGFRDQMNRGLGISAMFAGESGTGKTMAAEVLANALSLDLYRIDLSAVVSKYIGETETNLRKVFDAAEAGGAILFFDEADALFGKRTEVKDSHDRYANIEINYLLQRMESFCGLAILATNMKSVIDKAFLRRLRFIIDFPYPGAEDRLRIWERALAPRVPREAIDFAALSEFDLSGGSIHGVAINAAFAAATAGTPVTMALLLDAVRTEFRKSGRTVNEAAFVRIRAVSGTGGTP